MLTFQSFIETAAKNLDIPAADAGNAAGGLLDLVRGQVSEADGSALMKALPGASDYLGANKDQVSGGMLGGLMGSAGKLLGGNAGAAMGLMGIFKSANMDTGQAGKFAGMLFDLVGKNADSQLVSRILDQIPDLKKLLGR